MFRRLPQLDRALRVLGIAAAILALAGRLASGMMVTDPQVLSDVTALLAAAVSCQADADTSAGHPGKPVKPAPDQGLVSLLSSLSQPSPVLTPAVLLPAPRQGVLTAAALPPPARGPPPARPGAALPRGPPVLS